MSSLRNFSLNLMILPFRAIFAVISVLQQQPSGRAGFRKCTKNMSNLVYIERKTMAGALDLTTSEKVVKSDTA